MTTAELNRDIKRLAKMQKHIGYDINPEFQKEFMRLYRADNTFEDMNRQSILIMLVLNRKFRFVPLHSFGIFIEDATAGVTA